MAKLKAEMWGLKRGGAGGKGFFSSVVAGEMRCARVSLNEESWNSVNFLVLM